MNTFILSIQRVSSALYKIDIIESTYMNPGKPVSPIHLLVYVTSYLLLEGKSPMSLALGEKADPFLVSSWISMLKSVEGTEKFMKVLEHESFV